MQSVQCKNLRWQEPLSSDEIWNWWNHRRVPKGVAAKLAHAGVYRFIFAESRDSNQAHTPCYVGEAVNMKERLRVHFRVQAKDAGELQRGWRVRGAIQNSKGDFKLQVLAIDGRLNFCGLIFGPDLITDPLEESFLRRMLENWAILTSKYVDHLEPLNLAGPPHVKDELLKQFKASRKGQSRKSAKRGL